MNHANPAFDEFVFLCEGDPEKLAAEFGVDQWKDRPVSLVKISERTRFYDFFEHANRLFQGAVIVACNTDIYFDGTIEAVRGLDYAQDNSGSSRLLAITRHNLHPIEGFAIEGVGRINAGSQDAWVFKSPIRRFDWDIKIGICGCDAYVVQKAIDAGISVSNPCLSIRAIHFHPSQQRGHQNLDTGRNYWHSHDYRGCEVVPVKL